MSCRSPLERSKIPMWIDGSLLPTRKEDVCNHLYRAGCPFVKMRSRRGRGRAFRGSRMRHLFKPQPAHLSAIALLK